jgi:antirestriction protein ArdC
MKDIKQEITTRIVELIEEHGAGWTKPFAELGGVPTNVSTGKRYRGMNAFWLGLLGKAEVATYKQWAALDCQVRKGSKGTPVSVPMVFKDKDGKDKGLFFKSATVFSSRPSRGLDLTRGADC